MKNQKPTLLLGGLTALLSGLLLSPRLAAQDDRENSAPTAAVWYPVISASSLASLGGNGWRITNLKVVNTTGPTFAAALVKNTASYGKGWWWYYDQTEAQVRSLLSAKNARPIDIEPYVVTGGLLRYAVVMVSNTGAEHKNWWWITNTTTNAIGNAVNASNARVYDMDTYTVMFSSYYSAVLYDNTGVNARGWWYYFGIGGSQLAYALATNGARLIDVQRTGGDAYNVVMYQLPDKRWYALNRTSAQLTDDLTNFGARLVCLDVDTGMFSGGTFAAGMTDNLDDESRRINDLMRSTSDGYVGAYLKRANGPVSVAFSEQRGFEPASTLKTLHHVMTMRRVSLGSSSLGQNVTVYTGMNGSCPNDTLPMIESLETVLVKMMNDSDNARTKAVTTLLGGGSASNGLLVLSAGATSLGLASTEVNHHIGCGTPANVTTLVDLGELHEKVVNGYLGTQRQKFYDLMANGWSGGGYALGKVGPIVDDEATNAGLTSTQKSAFTSEFFLAGKRGGYGTGTGAHHTWAGYFKIPFYSVTSGISYREFVGGAFCGSATSDANANEAASTGAAEVLRAQIRAAMATWKHFVGGVIAYHGSGCPGTAGIPSHTVSGTPRIGGTLTFGLSSARPSTPVALQIGASKTVWYLNSLPMNLTALGAPGCYLSVAPTVALNGATNGSGAEQFTVPVPLNPSLVGGTIYTQFFVLDPVANPLHLVTTRGAGVTYGSAEL